MTVIHKCLVVRNYELQYLSNRKCYNTEIFCTDAGCVKHALNKCHDDRFMNRRVIHRCSWMELHVRPAISSQPEVLQAEIFCTDVGDAIHALTKFRDDRFINRWVTDILDGGFMFYMPYLSYQKCCKSEIFCTDAGLAMYILTKFHDDRSVKNESFTDVQWMCGTMFE